MLQQLVPALRMMLLLTVLTGLIYPGIVPAFAKCFFTIRPMEAYVETARSAAPR